MKINPNTIRPTLTRYLDREGWTAAELARHLDVHEGTIHYWRQQCGMPRRTGDFARFRRRWDRLHGAGASARLLRMTRQGATLRTIATSFGISIARAGRLRQYVRAQDQAPQEDTP